MSMVSRLAAIRSRWLWRAFERATEQPEKTQRKLLRRMIAVNAQTAFGQQHRFDGVSTVEEYRRHLPIADYEAFRGWIDRMRAGEANVLTAEAPYMFTTTSGTTGEPKFIPVNGWMRRSGQRVAATWISRSLRDHPRMLDGRALVIVSPAIEGHTAVGIPFGSASGFLYENASWLLRRAYAVPYDVFAISDYDAKYYVIMRHALERKVTFLGAPNPSTILRLLAIAAEHGEAMIRDIRDGTIADDQRIEPALRDRLSASLRPNAGRAGELERILERAGHLKPRDYWPDLALVGCWMGGSVGFSADRLRRALGDTVPMRDPGYLASEAHMSVPVEDSGSAGILAIETNFYEFIREQEIDDSNPRVRGVGELEPGETYYVIITTPSGLYRYDMNDVIRVTGFHRRTPLIEFVRKGRDMLSLEGEKLHVAQVTEAIKAAQASTGVQVEYYRAVGNRSASRYDLLLEPENPSVADEAVIELGRAIDRELAALNGEYQQKRRSGRLMAPVVKLMAPRWGRRRMQAKLALRGRDTQFKDQLLGMPDAEDWATEVVRTLQT